MKILMYHYVRPLETSRYPSIKGRRVEEFRGQLRYLRKHFHLCSPAEIFDCLQAEEPVPDNWALLTFDDGYSDHFRYVLPVLDDERVSALFFPPVSVITDRRLLDVNKIHFTLAAAQSVEQVYGRLIIRLGEHGFTAEDIEALKLKYYRANRFDGAEMIFIKRVLQKGLPFELRNEIASQLFVEFVSIDERAFAEELYLSLDECRIMARHGMFFGSHGRNHYWMGELNDLDQSVEISESIAFLNAIHSPLTTPLRGLAMSYPYGSYNAHTISELRKNGFAFALTTKVGDSDFSADARYEIKRYDTNDFPVN